MGTKLLFRVLDLIYGDGRSRTLEPRNKKPSGISKDTADIFLFAIALSSVILLFYIGYALVEKLGIFSIVTVAVLSILYVAICLKLKHG